MIVFINYTKIVLKSEAVCVEKSSLLLYWNNSLGIDTIYLLDSDN